MFAKYLYLTQTNQPNESFPTCHPTIYTLFSSVTWWAAETSVRRNLHTQKYTLFILVHLQPVLRNRSRPEPYFLAGAEIISYFRLRLQKIPYKNDFITTIFFSDHGIFITNIFKNNSYLLTLTSIFSIQPSKILYKRRHSLDTTDPAAFFKFNLFFISWSNSDTSCASKDIFAIVRIVITG